MTRLKLQLALMPDTPDLRACREDIGIMEKMITAYLDFARGDGEEAIARVNVSGLLKKYAEEARNANTNVHLSAEEDLTLLLRPIAFERCVSNIVNNARKYGSRILINLISIDDYIEITVEDNGPGIPEDLFEEVFKPFYRIDAARNIDSGGVGLGLPIAIDIVHSHGGRIWLEKSEMGGLKVVIQLPV